MGEGGGGRLTPSLNRVKAFWALVLERKLSVCFLCYGYALGLPLKTYNNYY